MPQTSDQTREIVSLLERNGTRQYREGLVRYGIVTDRAFGVSVADIKKLAKKIGRDHDLALSLWETGWYEARMLTAFVDEPGRVTATQMDRWARDFDNWGICDTLCFHLFDRTPHAWRKIEQWSGRREEFVKRAAFALLAGVALHDKKAPDKPFLDSLVLIERNADDGRNFVKKGVSWALRTIGHRNESLHGVAMKTATKLAASTDPAERWVGKDAIKDLSRPLVLARVEKRSAVRRKA